MAFVPLIDDVSAFVPWICVLAIELFFFRFWEPPRTGEVLPKFVTYTFL